MLRLRSSANKYKLKPSEDKPIDTLIINGAECEPFITADYRECMENYDDVINGIFLIKEILNIPNAIICVESNKEKAIQKLYEIATDARDEDDSVKLMRLPSKYPQGAEKVLIYSVFVLKTMRFLYFLTSIERIKNGTE